MQHVFICALGLLLAPFVVHAATVQVDRTRINIPAPAGFTLVTPAMKNLHAVLAKATPGSNIGLATFVSAKEAANALHGAILTPTYFSVQTGKCCADSVITDAWFGRLEGYMKHNHDQLMAREKHEAPSIFRRVESAAPLDKGPVLKLLHEGVVQLPVLYTTRNAMAFPTILTSEIQRGDRGPAVKVSRLVVTAFAHVRDKALILYCFAPVSDKGYAEKASKAWVDAIIAANR